MVCCVFFENLFSQILMNILGFPALLHKGHHTKHSVLNRSFFFTQKNILESFLILHNSHTLFNCIDVQLVLLIIYFANSLSMNIWVISQLSLLQEILQQTALCTVILMSANTAVKIILRSGNGNL